MFFFVYIFGTNTVEIVVFQCFFLFTANLSRKAFGFRIFERKIVPALFT